MTRTYELGDSTVRALGGVSVRIEVGDYLAVVGPSGSGKSTLMHLLGALDRPTSGTLRVGGGSGARGVAAGLDGLPVVRGGGAQPRPVAGALVAPCFDGRFESGDAGGGDGTSSRRAR